MTNYSEAEKIVISKNMRTYGGSFVQKLDSLYQSADPINKVKIEKTFKQYFDQYLKF